MVMSLPTKDDSKCVDICMHIAYKYPHTLKIKPFLPNCIGALDGKHVCLIQPPESGFMYYNYRY